LKGKKIKGQFVFENKGKSIKSYNLCKVSFWFYSKIVIFINILLL
jgi:hypothetical protein